MATCRTNLKTCSWAVNELLISDRLSGMIIFLFYGLEWWVTSVIIIYLHIASYTKHLSFARENSDSCDKDVIDVLWICTSIHKSHNQWMWTSRSRSEFWMSLSAYHTRMTSDFDHLDEWSVRTSTWDDKSVLFKLCSIVIVKFETVTMTLRSCLSPWV